MSLAAPPDGRRPKGAATNVGQNLSPHDTILPPEVASVLLAMSVPRACGEPGALEPLRSAIAGVAEVSRAAPSFRFSDVAAVYRRIVDLKSAHFDAATDLRLPPLVVFIDLAIVGRFGNLSRLDATGDWRGIPTCFLRRRG